MVNMTISIPSELRQRMNQFDANWSRICREAIRKHIEGTTAEDALSKRIDSLEIMFNERISDVEAQVNAVFKLIPSLERKIKENQTK